ncbi:YbjN domain-containing protein [Actinomyces respiraculi]|uniref:YbjN domain-containing protein n=1 Tax=Actinomyces respiraculi TaxID=2744574 RepID=UPI001F2D41C1|nr:YbjN domain-containing protein [Actinomyces respiraculi]
MSNHLSGRRRSLRGLIARLLGVAATPGPAAPTAEAPHAPAAPGPRPAPEAPTGEATSPLTLERIERMITGPMGYGVRRHEEEDHACLLGTWDGFPFVIEEPEEHPGWLLVSGDAEEPVSPGERDEVAASVNDWNREKYYPTVCLVETPVGTVVRATYLVDLTSGVTSEQLRLHLDTALSACTQALSHVGPLLPEL